MPNAVARGLKQKGIDIITTSDAGLRGASDAEQLDHAFRAERVVVTSDSDYLDLSHRGSRHAGIAYFPGPQRPIGELIEYQRG